jgi:T-complex protein 1 subunit gamma
VEKIPGGELEDSRILKGVMLNKDVTHSKMRRRSVGEVAYMNWGG